MAIEEEYNLEKVATMLYEWEFYELYVYLTCYEDDISFLSYFISKIAYTHIGNVVKISHWHWNMFPRLYGYVLSWCLGLSYDSEDECLT